MPSQDTLVADARAFLGELADNNTRAWFQANKARYEARLRGPSLALLDRVSAAWGRQIGASLSPKLFRPHRDVRFSKDKTPYHTHLHMLWGEANGPAWFLGIAPGYVTAGGGWMGFDRDRLERWRAAAAGSDGAELQRLLSGFPGRIDPPELKRVPAPYDKDHANGDLLRRKSFALWRDIESDASTLGLEPATLAAFTSVRPLLDHLRGMI